MTRPFLQLRDLDKRFGDLQVLRGISLDVERGEILALLGPSGSGKTTLLRMLAGFETPDAGRILVDGEEVSRRPPARRRFGMVFQHYALFPHLTVGENVAFGLDGEDQGGAREPRVAEMLELVDLPGFEARRPGQISGGQQQRVAVARALAPRPRVLLLDEPLSNLDPSLRERTRRELKKAVRQVGITTVLVTHEQEEAFDLGDRVAVLHDGRLEQVGTPEELYRRPATRFVAGFVGRASGLPGTVVRGGEAGEPGALRLSGHDTPEPWAGRLVTALADGAAAELVVRPESLALVAPGTAGALPGRVVERRYAGLVSYYVVAVDFGDQGSREVEVLAASDAAREGDAVAVALRDAPGEPDDGQTGDGHTDVGPEPRIFSADVTGPGS